MLLDFDIFVGKIFIACPAYLQTLASELVDVAQTSELL